MRLSKEMQEKCLSMSVPAKRDPLPPPDSGPPGKPAKKPRAPRKVRYVEMLCLCGPDGGPALFRLPIRVRSEANIRDKHWYMRHKRTSGTREELRTLLAPYMANLKRFARHYAAGGSLSIRFTKLGGNALDRLANLGRAFKAIEDELAEILGANDGDPRWMPEVDQSPGGPHGIAIRIECNETTEAKHELPPAQGSAGAHEGLRRDKEVLLPVKEEGQAGGQDVQAGRQAAPGIPVPVLSPVAPDDAGGPSAEWERMVQRYGRLRAEHAMLIEAVKAAGFDAEFTGPACRLVRRE